MFNDVVKIAKAKIVSDEIGNQEKVVDWENFLSSIINFTF